MWGVVGSLVTLLLFGKVKAYSTTSIYRYTYVFRTCVFHPCKLYLRFQYLHFPCLQNVLFRTCIFCTYVFQYLQFQRPQCWHWVTDRLITSMISGPERAAKQTVIKIQWLLTMFPVSSTAVCGWLQTATNARPQRIPYNRPNNFTLTRQIITTISSWCCS